MARSVAGRIIVINGPSSAGKTTLARAVRDARAPTAAAVSPGPFIPPHCSCSPHQLAPLCNLDRSHLRSCSLTVGEVGGFDVIVDTVFERADCLAIAKAALAGHTYSLVALTCALDVLEASEKERGDRRLGQARGQFERVLQNASCDLTLDTGVLSVQACVNRVLELFANSLSETGTRTQTGTPTQTSRVWGLVASDTLIRELAVGSRAVY